jgi:hypothetical protein
LGYGAYSADSSSSGPSLIVSIPITPAQAPFRNEATCTQTEITVNMPQITGSANTGGLPILSYQLEWATGAGSYTALVGASPDSLATSYQVGVAETLTTGTNYKFRYLVKNEAGSSVAYSPILSTYAAVAPSSVSAPTTSIVGYDVQINWSAPSSTGGLPITVYKVYVKGKDNVWYQETTTCSVTAT